MDRMLAPSVSIIRRFHCKTFQRSTTVLAYKLHAQILHTIICVYIRTYRVSMYIHVYTDQSSGIAASGSGIYSGPSSSHPSGFSASGSGIFCGASSSQSSGFSASGSGILEIWEWENGSMESRQCSRQYINHSLPPRQ